MTKGFVVAAVVSLLVVTFLIQFQTNEVDQNHLDWMGFFFLVGKYMGLKNISGCCYCCCLFTGCEV